MHGRIVNPLLEECFLVGVIFYRTGIIRASQPELRTMALGLRG
jgi:hypothetical protein